ncbi:MAG: aromatic ring-hydroxylating dioxygenase subunit alpha [Alphaproteobacteria bacterium]
MKPDSLDIRWPAQTNEIPKEVFTRADVFEQELKQIFYGPEWHPVAHESEIPKPGDFKTFFLGKAPLIINRDQEGKVRVFFNACAHRGNQLETAGAGNKTEFECPYHRWLFSANGDLIGCPAEAEFAPGFKRKDFPLAQPRMEIFYGLIFVTFSDQTPDLDTFLEDAHNGLKETLGVDGRLKLLGYQKVRYRTNWKAYADNDGYHAPLLHSAFRMLNWQGGKGTQRATRVHGHIIFDSALSVASGQNVLKDPSLIAFRGSDPSRGSRLASMFPTFIATSHLDVINLRFAIPLSVDETEVHYAYFAHQDDDAEMERHRLRQSSNLLGPCGLVSMEDASVFHRVHIGNHTPGNVTFQKGVKNLNGFEQDFKQNDESANLPRWEYYRRAMGFDRRAP